MSDLAELVPGESYDLGNGVRYSKCLDKDGNWFAIDEWHLTPDGKLCGGWVPFDVQSKYVTKASAKWTVNSYDPLDLSPSLLCTRCNHHGFIRQGQWIPA